MNDKRKTKGKLPFRQQTINPLETVKIKILKGMKDSTPNAISG
jgi:hypothetical protein